MWNAHFSCTECGPHLHLNVRQTLLKHYGVKWDKYLVSLVAAHRLLWTTLQTCFYIINTIHYWPVLLDILQQWPRFWFSPLCSPGLNESQSQCSPYLRLFICSFSFFCFCASETWSSFFQNHLSVLLQEFKVNSGILHRDIPGLAARPRRIKIPFEAGL